MNLSIAIRGDLDRMMREEVKRIERSVADGLREAAAGLRDDLRRHTGEAGLGRLARRWSFRFYANDGPLAAAAVVRPKGAKAGDILAAFDAAATIRPLRAKFLAIPTMFNRAGGRRGGKVLFRPSDLKDTFVQRSANGTLLLFARVQHAQRRTRGRVRDQAYVEGRLLGGGRAKRTRALLDAGAVPMFVLKPQVRLPKRLALEHVAAPWFVRGAEIVMKHWDANA